MSVDVYAGIDAGSSATKCVLLDSKGGLLAHYVVSSGFNYFEAAESALHEACQLAEVKPDNLVKCISTGYGRESVTQASRQVTEITCHARGAVEWYPEVRNIIDIGGQDTKIIRLNEQGKMTDYRMNAKCAAGTGTFLESVAVKLGITLADINNLALNSTKDLVINSYCTVFTGTEVIERIKAGYPREDISMGLFRSIANRVLEMIPCPDGPVAATGGVVAHCSAMIKALEDIFGAKVYLPPLPQHAGAYGAALIALN